MKKFLSIVISILMISAMMSVVALADATISLDAVTGLVAGEAIELTPTVSGAATYTVEVNNQVFGITGGTASGSITSKTVNAGEAFELTVNGSIPATFTSQIRLTAGTTQVKVDVSVADRLVGDANGVDGVTIYDAALIASYIVNGPAAVGDTFKPAAADANGLDGVTIYDAALIASYVVNGDTTIGTAYIGGNAALTIVDPFAGGAAQTELDAVTDLYAYYQDGKIYYTFTAAANATSYDITVGSAAAQNVSATSGSINVAAWDGTGTLAVSVVAKADGYTDSAATSTNAIYAATSGALATWLANNGLSDVAITVYEIAAE